MSDPTGDGLREASINAETDESIARNVTNGYLVAILPAAAAWAGVAYGLKLGEGVAVIPGFFVWMLVAGLLESRAKRG